VRLKANFHFPSSDTAWIGLNMILDRRLTEGELAVIIPIVAGVLFRLSAVAGWIATA
jgi:hypothetical protein